MQSRPVLFPILIASLLLLSSCARTIKFNNSPIVPAADGKVTLKEDKNNNYALNIKIKNLGPAKNLSPARSTYVVWMQTANSGTKNLGQLQTSSKFLSKALTASLQTVTSFEPVSFFVTAEDDAVREYPGSQVVLRTDSFR